MSSASLGPSMVETGAATQAQRTRCQKITQKFLRVSRHGFQRSSFHPRQTNRGGATVGRISTRKRRTTTGGPEAGRGLSSKQQAALPPRLEAVGEALASGSGTVVACEVAGATLARDGLSLAEVIDSLAVTSRLVRGTEPSLEETRALAVAWSDAALG